LTIGMYASRLPSGLNDPANPLGRSIAVGATSFTACA
jgi:hypothetical protein